MSFHYRTRAFVFKKTDRGEADQVFAVFSQDFGALKVLGRATRKLTSKLRPGIPLFSLSEIAFIQGRVFKTLTGTKLVQDFPNIKNDLTKLKIAYRISKVFNQLVQPPEKDEKIWNLLNAIFHYLDNYPLPVTRYPLLYYYFLWNLLAILGHKPELFLCLVCRKKLEPKKLYFSTRGGVMCASCCNKSKQEVVEIEPDVVKILREMFKRSFPLFMKIQIKKEQIETLERVSNLYVLAIRAR